jgi:hypothetical protein
VAHHSCAVFEADERGFGVELEVEFAPDRPDLVQALVYCDMTIDPDGRRVTFDVRLDEIINRYGADHVVSRSMTKARPTIESAVEQVERRLMDAAKMSD